MFWKYFYYHLVVLCWKQLTTKKSLFCWHFLICRWNWPLGAQGTSIIIIASFWTWRNTFKVAESFVFLEHPFSIANTYILTITICQRDCHNQSYYDLLSKKEYIYPGLPSMTTLPHSSKCSSLGDNVYGHLIYPSLYIKHYRNWRLPGYCLSYGFFSSHTLCLMPFSILSQHPKSVLCAIWSSWSPCIPFFPPVCSFQPPVLTEIWLFSEDSASHLGLVVGVGCDGVLLAPHCSPQTTILSSS